MIELNRIYNEDCLEGMKRIPDGSVDLVLTDPPYKLIGGGRKNTILPSRNTPFTKSGECFATKTLPFADWMPEIYRVLKPSRYAFFMSNDRNMKDLWESCENAGFKFCEVLVMSKNTAVPGCYFYKSCEFILMFRKGAYKKLEFFGTKSVFTVKMPTGKNKNHPTEKPVSMLQEIAEITTKDGNVVLDPFMGSGSTGVACINTGRNFIGFELDKHYCDIANERIRKALAELDKEGE